MGPGFGATLDLFLQFHLSEANNLAHLATSPLGVIGLLCLLAHASPQAPLLVIVA